MDKQDLEFDQNLRQEEGDGVEEEQQSYEDLEGRKF